LLLALLLALGGCGKDDNGTDPDPGPDDELELEVGNPLIQAEYPAGTYYVEVFCNDQWTATVNTEAGAWCTLTEASGDGDGAVTVNVTANTYPSGGDSRSATITVTSGDLTATATLTQYLFPCTPCTQCLWDATAADGAGAWVDGYVTATTYPFDDNTATGKVRWLGEDISTYYEGARSANDGRANTAALAAAAQPGSAVKVCTDLGAGWYLPAYEELTNLSGAKQDGSSGDGTAKPLTDLDGAGLLVDILAHIGDYWFMSSTEVYNNTGRTTSDAESNKANNVVVAYSNGAQGTWNGKTNAYAVQCVWRPE
jgi:hypothetical protein